MTQFDPASFLDATISEPLVKRPPLPIGDYTALIGEVASRAWQGKTDPSKSGIVWDVPLTVQVPADVQASFGLKDTITLKDGIMIDLTPGGTIDTGPGRNGRLRLYREACDLNKPGDSFSARLMQGRVIKVKIGHEIYQDSPIEKVTTVTKS